MKLLTTPDELAAKHPGKNLEEVVLELTGGLEEARLEAFFATFPSTPRPAAKRESGG